MKMLGTSFVVTLAAILGLLTSCGMPTEMDSGSGLLDDSGAVESQNIWLALGTASNGRQDMSLTGPNSPSEMGICIIEEGQSEAEGLCYSAEKETKHFVIKGVELSPKTKIVKLKSTAKDGAQTYRKIKLVPRTSGTPGGTVDIVTPVAGINGGTPPADISALPALPESMNLDLIAPDSSAKKLSDVFTKKYLLVELSAYDCGPCRSFATRFNRKEAEYAKYFEEGQCSKIVIVSDYGGLRGRQSQWIQMLGGPSSYLGKVSYSTKENSLKRAATSLGFGQSFGIPKLFMIDREGNLVDSGSSGMPSRMGKLCTK